jgi:histone acetyltransferase (RNA polymerase elongator complex component)
LKINRVVVVYKDCGYYAFPEMECASKDVEEIENIIPKPMNLFKDQNLMETVVEEMLKTTINSQKDMDQFIRQEQRKIRETIAHNQLLYTYRHMVEQKKIKENKHYERFLKSKVVRNLSGICQITVVMGPGFKTLEDDSGNKVEFNRDPLYASERTVRLSQEKKRYSCRHDCWYCPDQPGQPRSYLKTEPAVARANQFDFDPILQFQERAKTMMVNGMEPVKIEANIKGGTFSEYDETYRMDFVHRLYYAANTLFDQHPMKSLEEEIQINETTMCNVIGLTVEVRPDSIAAKQLIEFRKLGVTRIEMGVQSTFDSVLKYINRGCKHIDSVKAMKLLKDNNFKVCIHIMYDLPSSNPEMDKEMTDYIFDDPDMKPDDIKLYPCTVVPFTKIEIWDNNYKRNYDTELNPENLSPADNRIYKPYADEIIPNKFIQHGKNQIHVTPLIELLIYCLSKIPLWIRIDRIIRDIPGSHYVLQKEYHEDMRQIINKEMKNRGLKCREIRAREVKDKKCDMTKAKLFVRQYQASGGTEYFISFESPDEEILYGFLRLRISKDAGSVFPELKNTALIRELHVYGQVVSVDQKDNLNDKVQHKGFGKLLIQKAEEIALLNNYTRISVIAGVGVRNYYRKLGYHDHPGEGNFQIKILHKKRSNVQQIMSIICIMCFSFTVCYMFDHV